MSLHSYVVNTKSTGKRNVLLLSTFKPILGITKDDGKQKPAINNLCTISPKEAPILWINDHKYIHASPKVIDGRWWNLHLCYTHVESTRQLYMPLFIRKIHGII